MVTMTARRWPPSLSEAWVIHGTRPLSRRRRVLRNSVFAHFSIKRSRLHTQHRRSASGSVDLAVTAREGVKNCLAFQFGKCCSGPGIGLNGQVKLQPARLNLQGLAGSDDDGA